MLFSTWGHRKKKMKKGKGSATNSDRPNHKVSDRLASEKGGEVMGQEKWNRKIAHHDSRMSQWCVKEAY